MTTPAKKAKFLKKFNDKSDFPFTYLGATSTDIFCKYCEKTFMQYRWDRSASTARVPSTRTTWS